jgi:hypothetical protein
MSSCSPLPLQADLESLVGEFVKKAAVMPVDGDLELLIMEAQRDAGPLLARMAVSAREQANASKEAAFPPSGLPAL